jgi:hypothetical protein
VAPSPLEEATWYVTNYIFILSAIVAFDNREISQKPLSLTFRTFCELIDMVIEILKNGAKTTPDEGRAIARRVLARE